MHSHEDQNRNEIIAANQSGIVPQQADNDQHLIQLWLVGRPTNTVRAYLRDVNRLLEFTERLLHHTRLGDLQDFAFSLEATLGPSSIHRTMSAVKSLFGFGHRLGYLQFDVARAFKLPKFRNDLAERILDEAEVCRMIALENQPRNRCILLTLYAGAFRVAEITQLKWKHLQNRDQSGQVTVFGKGGKTRAVLMPESVWTALQSVRGDAKDDAPVFKSRKKGHLHESQIWRIVRKASERAEIDKAVSCHWLRHAHASHALDRGAPIHLVQATLGHASVATTGRYLHARPTESSGSYLPL